MASSKIKGITIEIGGETTKLGKALEGVETQSKGLQRELKGVESLLKLDPSNVNLLKQKQELLTQSIEATETKLKTLNSTMAKIKSGEIKVTEEQFRDLQREIVNTEQKLKKLKDESKDFGTVFKQLAKVAGDDIKELGGKVEEAGKKMAGVSAVAGAGLVAATKSAADNETAINKYIASTGKAISETGRYKDLMETIYQNNYGESIADVADKMRIVSNIMGDLPETELQSIVEKSYMLQDAYDMDFQENIRGVNALMDQFGITSEQAYELINQGAQKGLNQNQDLTDQIAEYSTYYAKLGFTAEDFFNMMISGAQDGAYQMDYLNDAIKEFGIRTKDNSDGTKEAFKSLGLNADKMTKKFAKGGKDSQEAFAEVTKALMKMKDPIKRNEIGVQLFGTKFEDLEESAVFAMSSAKDQVDMLGSTVESTSDTMYGGTGAKAQEAVRSIQTAFATLGETLLPILAPIVEKIAELATKFSELNPTVQNIVLIVTGLITAFGPVIIFVGKIISAIGLITEKLGLLGPVINKIISIAKLLFGLIAAHPVIAIITAIIAAIILLWTKCEWFRDLVKALWEGIKKGFQAAVDWISEALKNIGEFFSNLWEGIKKVFGVVGNWFKDVFTTAWNGIKGAWNGVTSFFSGIWNGIKKAFGSVGSWFKNTFTSAWTAVKNVFSTGGKIFDGIKDGIASTFKTVVNGIIGGINKVIAVPFNAINKVLNKIRNVGIGGAKPFKGLISTISVPKIPKLKVGTDFVPYDGMPAILHKGEQVVPAKYNPTENNEYMKNAMFDALTDFTNIRSQGNSEIKTLTNLMNKYMPQIVANMGQNIVLDDNTLVGKITPKIDASLGNLAARRKRGY